MNNPYLKFKIFKNADRRDLNSAHRAAVKGKSEDEQMAWNRLKDDILLEPIQRARYDLHCYNFPIEVDLRQLILETIKPW